jgi:hypothetical protein
MQFISVKFYVFLFHTLLKDNRTQWLAVLFCCLLLSCFLRGVPEWSQEGCGAQAKQAVRALHNICTKSNKPVTCKFHIAGTNVYVY